jgi:hypothetical protein
MAGVKLSARKPTENRVSLATRWEGTLRRAAPEQQLVRVDQSSFISICSGGRTVFPPFLFSNMCNIAQTRFHSHDRLIVSQAGDQSVTRMSRAELCSSRACTVGAGAKVESEETIAARRSKMKILVPALVVSMGLLSLLYRALCSWAQSNMRKAMYGEGQVPGNTPATHSGPAALPPTSLQNSDN